MDAQPGKTLAALRQIVFAAPDIDRDTFVALAEKFHGQAERLTLYGSSNDRAIQASKVVHRYPRAGGSGKEIALANGIDSIDSSAADTSLLGHSYFGDRRSILSDLFSLLRHAHPPDQRYGLASRNRANFRYWVYKP
jgi:esterase/lipase superfamily enzyme